MPSFRMGWWRRATKPQRQEQLAAWRVNKPFNDFHSHADRHRYAARGGEITGVTIGSISETLDQYDALHSFCQLFAANHGANPAVRLKCSFVFEARDGTGISALELSVLAAIYSIIGNKQGPVLILQERIRCRALGYKSAAVMMKELPKRQDKATPLTDWQLRTLPQKLAARKFYARSTYGHRQTYYSHRMTHSKLRAAIIDRKTFMFANKLMNQLDDQAMTEAIRNQRAMMAGHKPPAPDARPVPVGRITNLGELASP